jgi:hypothetical protein
MEFKEKFSTTSGKYGKCLICGKETEWIIAKVGSLVVTEHRVFICSEECVQKFDELYQEQLDAKSST